MAADRKENRGAWRAWAPVDLLKPGSGGMSPGRPSSGSLPAVQYRSGTNRRPLSVAWSSYACLFERFGSLIFSRGTFLYGIVREKVRDAVQSRALLVVGADDVPGRVPRVGRLEHRSRAREYSYHFVRPTAGPSGSASTGAAGPSMRASKRRSCSLLPTSSQYLIRRMPPSTMYFSASGQSSRNRSYCASVQKPMTRSTPSAVVPAPVEDHDLARGREVRHVALHVHLALLAVRGRGQRHDAGRRAG